jgi:hypothetical protein
MVETGDFTEPTTRKPLTEEQLNQLDKMAKEMDCGLPSVQEAKNTKSSQYTAKREVKFLVI